MTPPVLSIREVRKSFGTVRALNGVSLDIRRGENIGPLATTAPARAP